jgi:uncharacterized membrane protein
LTRLANALVVFRRHFGSGAGGQQRLKTGLRTFGWLLIAGQLVVLLWWSTVVVGRASMSADFGAYYQAWYEVAHGHLLFRSTVLTGSIPYWRNDGEFFVYLLAPLYWLFPNHQLGFWWLQDLALFGVSAVCYRWIGELLPWTEGQARHDRIVAGVGWTLTAVLLVFNPWIYWTALFAVHLEPFAVLCAILALRALLQRHRTVWVWSVLTALCGASEDIYVISIGLCGIAAVLMGWRKERRVGARSTASHLRTLVLPVAVGVFGIAWLFLLELVHANEATSSIATPVSQGLAYLAGSPARSGGSVGFAGYASHAVLHFATVLRVVASHGWNLWANTAPVGVVGLFSGIGFFLSVPTLLEYSILSNQDFSYPGFPSLIVYAALAVATALVVAAILRRRPALGELLAVIIVANAAVWFGVWIPDTASQYVRIDAKAASAIARAAAEIPSNAEVVASQGLVGNFAARPYVYVYGSAESTLGGILNAESFPVRSSEVWFVLSPNQGIEVPSTGTTEGAIGAIARLAGVKMTAQADGVWVFRWNVPPGIRSVTLGGLGSDVPAWAAVGAAARPVLAGPAATWLARSTGVEGYLVSGDEWGLSSGTYRADVELSSTVPVNVEVWEDSSGGDRLLARQVVVSRQLEQVALRFQVPAVEIRTTEDGPAIFRYEPVPPRAAANIEIRIWTPGGGRAAVRSMSVSGVVPR